MSFTIESWLCPQDEDGMANSVDPDPQSLGAFWSASTLFAQTCLSKYLGLLQHWKLQWKVVVYNVNIINAFGETGPFGCENPVFKRIMQYFINRLTFKNTSTFAQIITSLSCSIFTCGTATSSLIFFLEQSSIHIKSLFHKSVFG